MGSLSKFLNIGWVALCTCAYVMAAAPDEEGFLGLWEKHQKSSEDHAGFLKAAAEFEQANAESRFLPVIKSLAAWHQIEAGNKTEGMRAFEALLSPKPAHPMALAAQEIALSWLTRNDMELVKEGLNKVFADNIEYPDTLAPVGSLSAQFRPPMADRWGAPWVYSPADFKRIKAGARSNYVLQSSKLGEFSDLEQALRRPYGGSQKVSISRMAPLNGKNLLKVAGLSKGQILVGEGAVTGRVSFPYYSDTLILLSDGDYWFVEKTP